MIAVIRISGRVKIGREVEETLNRLRLGRKLTCTFVDEKDTIRMGMVKSVRNHIAFGEVDKKLMDDTIEKRGQKDIEKKYRGFCRLHPPVGGFKKSTKKDYPKGVLGHNKEISKLLARML